MVAPADLASWVKDGSYDDNVLTLPIGPLDNLKLRPHIGGGSEGLVVIIRYQARYPASDLAG